MCAVLTTACLLPGPAIAAEKVDVFAALDAGETKKLGKLSAKKLLKTLRKGRKAAKVQPGVRRTKIVDGFGRKTQLQLTIPKKPTGVIFLLHGLGGSGNQLVPSFRKFAAKNGLIIAAPDAQKEPNGKENEDSNDTTKGFPHWWSYRPEAFVLRSLRDLKREFVVNEDRIYLSGYSMGGFATWNLGLRYPDRFAAIVPMAGGISQHEYVLDEHDAIRKLLLNALHLPTYFLHGDADRTVPVRFDRATRDGLKRLGYDHTFVEVAGAGHMLDIRSGKPLLRGVTDWLSKKERNAHPKRVHFHSLGSYMPQSYWIRIDGFEGKGPAEVDASIKGKNKIEVTTTGVKALTVFLDDELVNLRKSITVTVNGDMLHKGKVKTTRTSIIESWTAREDRQLIYPAQVRLDLTAATKK